MIVLANELYIIYDGTQIACTTDFTLEVSKEQIDVNCGQKWNSSLASSKSWNLDFSSVVKRDDTNGYLKYNDLMTKLVLEDQPVLVALRSTVANDKYYQGQGLLTNLTQTGSTDENVTYSGSIQGYLDLTIVTGGEPSTGIPYPIPHLIP